MSIKFPVRWIILLMPAIFVVWLISCCKPTEEAATSTAVIPTQTVEPISAVPVTTGTATPLPPTPSQTSHIPAQTPTLTVNPEISTQIATPDLSNMQVQTSTSLSPDGNWGARITVALPFDKNGVNTGNSYYEKLKIIGQYQSVEWTVVDGWAEYKKGYTIPLILQWSSDGLYLYIADFELPSACEKYGFTRNIRRMELSNGSLKPVAPDLEGSLSLSPDERWLVAVKDDQITVHSLTTNQEQEVTFPVEGAFWQAGSFTWSPDSHAALFSLETGLCGPKANRTTTIYRLDLEPFGLATVVPAQVSLPSLKAWPVNDQALMIQDYGYARWLNIRTGQISFAPPHDLAEAEYVLYTFFEALHDGQYIEAAELYGGSYETLSDSNPSVNPQDHVKLLENACIINGFQCLRIKDIVQEVEMPPGKFNFVVEFFLDNGNLFIQGECYGGNNPNFIPRTQFYYTVLKGSQGKFLVQELPIYTP